MDKPFKIPESVLVVIYTPTWEVLLIRRADADNFWQSVTGSKDDLAEAWAQTAEREVMEETGIVCRSTSGPWPMLQDWQHENVYSIYPQWQHRYAPGVSQNREHVFGLQVPGETVVQINPREHTAYRWLPYRQAAAACFSPTNTQAILMLDRFAQPARALGGGEP